jgi:hypothetical protein
LSADVPETAICRSRISAGALAFLINRLYRIKRSQTAWIVLVMEGSKMIAS